MAGHSLSDGRRCLSSRPVRTPGSDSATVAERSRMGGQIYPRSAAPPTRPRHRAGNCTVQAPWEAPSSVLEPGTAGIDPPYHRGHAHPPELADVRDRCARGAAERLHEHGRGDRQHERGGCVHRSGASSGRHGYAAGGPAVPGRSRRRGRPAVGERRWLPSPGDHAGQIRVGYADVAAATADLPVRTGILQTVDSPVSRRPYSQLFTAEIAAAGSTLRYAMTVERPDPHPDPSTTRYSLDLLLIVRTPSPGPRTGAVSGFRRRTDLQSHARAPRCPGWG